jgi:hypothetical protein
LIQIATGNGWDGRTVPAVRVAPARYPASIDHVALTNEPIVGATVHNNRLYLVQPEWLRSPWLSFGNTNPLHPRSG